LAVASLSSAAQDLTVGNPDGKIEQQVLDDLATGGGLVTFWVYLDEQADLSAAAGIADRDQQGRYVYEALTTTAERSQAGLRALLDAESAEYEPFWIANTIKVTTTGAVLEQIAARPEVAQITADRVYELPDPIPGEAENTIQAVEWGIARINAPQVWNDFGVRGEDIVVGAIDTGALFSHEALVRQYRGNLGGGEFNHNYNWHDPSRVCGNPSLAPCDNNGHGTHVTGTMVGDDGDPGANQIGVAPHAKWIIAKGCETTSCSNAALLSSGQFILAPTDLNGQNPRPDLRPHVVNNSWGGGANTDPWYRQTVQAWVAAGIFPQFANGNNIAGCTASSNPGNLPESYAAGAFDINNNMAGFSNRGPSAWGNDIIKPNVSAPGVNVRSSWNNGGYQAISGTSMASPHVAGTVALLWSAAPALVGDIQATRELLDTTAVDTSDLSCGGTPQNNNVWGEGRLDAFAAVDDAPRGDTGILAGVVRDAANSNPIQGATVRIVGAVERQRITGPDGAYSLRLPVGTYTVTVTAFGYGAQTAEVVVVVDQTTTRNFDLQTVPRISVRGRVTDGSGHGWALYAEVRAAGTPARTFTDPLTGEYDLRLPVQATYNLVVEPQYPGYATESQTIEVGDSDVTLDVALTVDRCAAAPGYDFDGDIGILGDFQGQLAGFLDSQGIPSTPFNWGDDVSQYDTIIVHRPTNPGQAAFVNFLNATDAAGTGVVFLDNWSAGNGIWLLQVHTGNPATRSTAFNTAIPRLFYEVTAEHPVLEGFAVGEQVVFEETSQFKTHSWFGGYAGDGRMVIGNAGRSDTGVVGPGIGVQQRTNNRHVLLSLHAVESWVNPSNWTAGGRQIFMNAVRWTTTGASFECNLVPGGLVLGHVTDLNTGDGLNGATVASVGAPSELGKSAATPDDPALDDGFYWLFSSRTGSQQFTASAGKYVSVTQTVNVVEDGTAARSFALPAGLLALNRTGVEATVRLGDSAVRTFTVTNDGTAPASIELGERRGSFEILGGGYGAPERVAGAVRNVEGEFSPAARPPGGVTETPADAAPAADPWTNLPTYPIAIMDNSSTIVDGKVYSFGGFAPTGVTANAYVFDPDAGSWSQIASLPGPRQKAEVVDIDGRIYILGGWEATATTSTLFIYDPASDSYTQGASMPAGRTAPGAAVLDGQIYAVGGCTTNACSPMATSNYRYDPGADAWETLASYPEPTSWLACAGLEGQVYCAGGTDGSIARTSTWAYDPGGDAWERKANMPYDNWAMAYAAASGQFVLSGGVTNGFATITNRGAAYDPGTDAWREIEASNTTVYRMGSACGFYKVGGSTGGFSPSATAERHPDFADCDVSTDVPWFSLDPLTATLQPGASVVVRVTVDGRVDQPGTYTGGAGIRHDTPYKVNPVGVTMLVTAPNNWGKIAGTVTGVSCKGDVSPLVGATVQINGKLEQLPLKTDKSGRYARWMATGNNPLNVIVAQAGYQPQTRQVQLKPKQTTLQDFHLQAIC
jgi:subtilisin family serine protease